MPLRVLSWTGYIEGASFLILLFIAMPLKYWAGWPVMVTIVGTAHGGLWIAYIIILINVAIMARLPWWAIPGGFVGSILPFGPFVFDRVLMRQIQHSA